MSLITNGDFSDGLNGWIVSGAGPTAPTHDPVNNRVVFGSGDNDVQDGDRLEQEVALEAGEEYTLTFTASELGSAFGGFGLNIELIDVNGAGNTQFLDFVIVSNDDTTSVDITFTANFDDPLLRIRGAFGFGGVDSTLILDNFLLTCFVAGTRILTVQGEKAVEDLIRNDVLVTHPPHNSDQRSAQSIRRIFRRSIAAKALEKNDKLRPVCIAAGSLGNGRPKRDLYVSRQHRMLVQSKIAKRMFDSPEVLIPAIRLVGLPGISIDERPGPVTYFHILLACHDVIFAEGAPTESLFAGAETIASMSPDAKEEILTIFPALAELGVTPDPARLIPSPRQQKRLIARHQKNRKPIQSGQNQA